MVAEVAIACCVGARYDGYAHGEHGDGERFLQVEHPFLLKLSYYCHSLGGHVAEGVCGVDVGDNPRKAVCGMEVGRHMQQDLHPLVWHLPCSLDKIVAQALPLVAPAFGRRPCHGC